MNSLQKSFHFPLLIFQHLRASPSLARTPEPDTVMAGESVTEYVEAGRTNLAVVYAVVLEAIHRARNAGSRGRLLDLACGPGQLALLAGKLLEFGEVVGVDLSEQVLERARAHAREQGWASRARFEAGDVSRLAGQPAHSADVVTFTNGAHHLSDLEAVRATLAEMERVARPDGLLVVADLVRFKDARTTDRFIELMA
jgi:ubiquinone/menaquinone biosynthesis C-methylase UbiE